MSKSLEMADAIAIAQANEGWIVAAVILGLLVGWSSRRQHQRNR